MLTQRRLKKVLRYDRETGVWYWRELPANQKPREIAGGLSGGQLVIQIDGERHGAARLAWLYVTGKWPKQIGYRDGNRLNTRWTNICESTFSQSAVRGKIRKTNKTGFRGVSIEKRSGKFRADITKDGRQHDLGRYETAAAAAQARLKAELRLFGTVH